MTYHISYIHIYICVYIYIYIYKHVYLAVPVKDYYDASGDEGGAGSDDAAVRRGTLLTTAAVPISMARLHFAAL